MRGPGRYGKAIADPAKLRRKHPAAEVARVWRTLLLLKVLGYWPQRGDLIAEAARRLDLPRAAVLHVYLYYPPDGCYDPKWTP